MIPFPQGVVKVLALAELRNCGAWKRALQNKCKDHRYYEIVQETLQCGFEHHYLLIEDHAGQVRAIQPVFFVRQNLFEGVRGRASSIMGTILKMFLLLLTMSVRRVGCGAGAGDLGACAYNLEPCLAKPLHSSHQT